MVIGRVEGLDFHDDNLTSQYHDSSQSSVNHGVATEL